MNAPYEFSTEAEDMHAMSDSDWTALSEAHVREEMNAFQDYLDAKYGVALPAPRNESDNLPF